MKHLTRRQFVGGSILAAALATGRLEQTRAADPPAKPRMKFGLVTYMWGAEWDLPTLIANCRKAGLEGVELRVDHKHAVSPALTLEQRKQVRRQFEEGKITLAGYGTNYKFDYVDPAKLKADIEQIKKYVQLAVDTGASGVKVKPNDLPKEVSREQTIQQIGKGLNEVARFAADFNIQIRMEVHGACCELPTIKAIVDVADHPNARLCWNSNGADLKGPGSPEENLQSNFNLVKHRFGQTVHVRPLDDKVYPFRKLLQLFKQARYDGWILLEAANKVDDKVEAMIQQRKLFEEYTA
jgi:sugar phosphate isomerase/epimerase